MWDVPPDVDRIPDEWEPPSGVREGENDFENVGHGGPKPPEEHTYRFKLYALDTTLDLDAGASKGQLSDAMEGHVLAQTQLTGTFAP